MARIEFDKVGERTYTTGIDHVVLYPQVGTAYPKGVAWNGITKVSENAEGGDANEIWADNIKYLVLRAIETLKLSIEAYDSPVEFDACDGTAELMPGVKAAQQSRQNFGLSYRTLQGNDTEGTDHNYFITLVYGCSASPSTRDNNTVNDSPEAQSLSWEIDTVPVAINTKVGGKSLKPTSIITVDAKEVGEEKMAKLESVLYGSESDEPRLPLPDELFTILA